MKVTLVQTFLHWEDSEKNISHFDQLLGSINEKTDLIVLPEMFSTGFTMKPEKLAEPANGPALRWMKEKAKQKKAVICGSVSIEEDSKFYNRLYWVEPHGNFTFYNKRHLFRMAKEDQHYTMGNKKIITGVGDWKICPLVCYDLRFPVWSRNRFIRIDSQNCKAEYDVLIYVANWPEVRSYPWKQLLIARAIENQCYVIGVNRVGKDGNGYDHSGDSMVINPRGEILVSLEPHQEIIQSLELDRNYLEEFRKTFPVGLDADDFNLA